MIDNSVMLTEHELPIRSLQGAKSLTRPVGQWARLLENLAFYGILVVLVLSAVPYGTVEPWTISLVIILVCVLAAARSIEGLVSNEWRIRQARLIAPLIGLILLAVIQTIPFIVVLNGGTSQIAIRTTISFDTFETWSFIYTLVAIISAGEILLRYTTTERRLLTLVYVTIGVGLTSALFGLARQLTQGSAGKFFSPYLLPGAGYAQFINRNHFAFLMEMTFGLLLGLIIKGRSVSGSTPLHISIAAVIWVALISANSRGGVLSMGGMTLFAAFFYSVTRQPVKRSGIPGHVRSSLLTRLGRLLLSLVMGIILFGVMIFAIAFVGGDSVAGRLETVKGELQESSSHAIRRSEIWKSTIELIREHPIAGVGFGGYWQAITLHDQTSGEASLQQAHNDYLELLASGGLTAAALFLIFVVELVSQIRKGMGAHRRRGEAARFGAVVGLVGIALHSAVDFGLHTLVNALMCMLLVVIASAQITEEREATPGSMPGLL
jgi:putative inorganic carbon (HCO3(-)) transporter